MMKEKGVLLPIFSLPSKYGIGDFGYEAYDFVDILSENEITYWEILPISACDKLPYSPLSYYALNENYISLDKLKESGLISTLETRPTNGRAIYDDFKEKYYAQAFSNFQSNEEYEKFIKIKEIEEYVEYMANKTGKNKEYFLFLQYILYVQWMELKKYANSKNVKIVGDMPFYPAFDSAETQYHSDCFEMKDGKFTYEAGTPPDYFNRDGQKWNSPVYNIKKLKRDNYRYLVKRFEYQLKLFDKVRIDYFRGYDSFFRIPIGKTGRDGEYVNSLGYGFFDKVFKSKKINKDNFIIEDLGDIRDATIKLREYYDFTRQIIFQFSLDLNNVYDKDNYTENAVILPGNHDCNTIYGWYKTLNDGEKWGLHEFLRRNECCDYNVNIGIMQYCAKCKARIAIISAQDILGLDENARINLPGSESDKNWSWKLEDFEGLKREIKNFK